MHFMGRRFWRLVVFCAALAFAGQHGLAETKKPELTLFVTTLAGYMGNPEPNPGMLEEMTRLAAEKYGYRLKQKIVPWARAMKRVKEVDNSLIISLSRIPSREAYFTWIVPQLDTEYAFISLAAKIDSLDAARRQNSIGVFRATVHQEYLNDQNFTNLRLFNKFKPTIRMMEAGRLDAWFGSVDAFSRRWLEFAEDKERRIFVGEPIFSEQLWLAGGKKLAPQIVADFAAGTRQIIAEGQRARLQEKYFSDE